jgi:hypothetical protein
MLRVLAIPAGATLLWLLAACSPTSPALPLTSDRTAQVLLFNGSGTSPNDVTAVERVLQIGQLEYSLADSRQMNAMTESRLSRYRLLIIPGGNFEAIGKRLTPDATAAIRGAVEHGLHYLGICAGAFFAGNSFPNGLNLTSGVRFGFYSDEWRGIRKAVVAVTLAGAETLDQYWEDGPQLAGWGAVVGKYPDGTPAIVEGAFGGGWVILSGVHPEAPEGWRRGMPFRTPASVDHAYAGRLIDAALRGEPLPHF